MIWDTNQMAVGCGGQVESGPWRALADGFPRFMDVDLKEVTLRPGCVLYIPPFWFHSVEAVGDDVVVSLNAYQAAPHKVLIGEVFTFLFREAKSLSPDVFSCPRAAACFLFTLLSSLSIDPRDLTKDVVETRWSRIGLDDFFEGDAGRHLKTTPAREEREKASNKETNRTAQSDDFICRVYGRSDRSCDVSPTASLLVAQLRDRLQRVQASVPEAFGMIIADFVEVAAAELVGLSEVYTFLHCMQMDAFND